MTAYFCGVNGFDHFIRNAIAVYDILKDMGLKVPDDVSMKLALHQFGALEPIRHLSFGNKNLDDKNTFEDPDNTTFVEKPVEEIAEGNDICIQGYSFHLLSYKIK